jgi:splicing factor 3A subunit 3
MSETLLEKTRAAHEDIELFKRAASLAMMDDARSHRDNMNQVHWMNNFTDKICDRYQTLHNIYEDKHGDRQREIQDMAMGGKGPQLFSTFYEQLKEIKEFHRKSPYLSIERPEAEQLLNNLEGVDNLFSGEESFGKYLDLHPFFQQFINLTNVERVDYIEYLERFSSFPDRDSVKNQKYVEYVDSLCKYLVNFVKRTQPMYDIDAKAAEFEKDFNQQWENGSFLPVGYCDIDREREESGLWCKESQKLFKSEAVLKNYLAGKKFQKDKKWYNTTFRLICLNEMKIEKMSAFLEDAVEATKEHVQIKFAIRGDEGNNEDEAEGEVVDSDSSEEVEIKLEKANYPVGWDGNPIPFWLYKLHGLGIEYKCEICGNMSYWGPRAFDRHFQEWRHSHGMKCLRLENSKEFHHITKIQDALELDKRLKELKSKDVWKEDEMEECEDFDGNVMNKKTFLDLRAQGLI